MTTVNTPELDTYQIDLTAMARKEHGQRPGRVRHSSEYVRNCPCDGCPWCNRCKVYCQNFKNWVSTGKNPYIKWE